MFLYFEELSRVLGYEKVVKQGVTPTLAFNVAIDLTRLGYYISKVPKFDWPSVNDVKDLYLFDLLFASNANALTSRDKKVLRAGKSRDLPITHPNELRSYGYLS